MTTLWVTEPLVVTSFECIVSIHQLLLNENISLATAYLYRDMHIEMCSKHYNIALWFLKTHMSSKYSEIYEPILFPHRTPLYSNP